MSEQVNHPQHYGGENNPYEAIKVIEAWELDFHLGNTVKYISRAGKKETDKKRKKQHKQELEADIESWLQYIDFLKDKWHQNQK